MIESSAFRVTRVFCVRRALAFGLRMMHTVCLQSWIVYKPIYCSESVLLNANTVILKDKPVVDDSVGF